MRERVMEVKAVTVDLVVRENRNEPRMQSLFQLQEMATRRKDRQA